MVAVNCEKAQKIGAVTELPIGFQSHAKLCQRLEEICPRWLETRFVETDVIAALPRFHNRDNGLRPIWCGALPPSLTLEEADAEAELSRACERGGWLGLSRHGFVSYRFAEQFDDRPEDVFGKLLASMSSLGWELKHLDQIRRGLQTTDHLHHRTLGAAGWLICNLQFRDERDALLAQWQSLPEKNRPALPLGRLPRFDSMPEGCQRQRSSRLTEFWRSFNEFCDRWRLLGMVTWDLPNTDGPKWSEGFPGRPSGLEGFETLDTPWHFPVMFKDRLGKLIEERHQQQAIRHGFDDQPRWATYAHLLTIHFWERVIRSRYVDRRSSKPAVSRIIAILAELTGCDDTSVAKLRKTLNSFMLGTRTSLRGKR